MGGRCSTEREVEKWILNVVWKREWGSNLMPSNVTNILRAGHFPRIVSRAICGCRTSFYLRSKGTMCYRNHVVCAFLRASR